jgi:hypothetical protein
MGYEILAVFFLVICFFFSITLYISFGEKQPKPKSKPYVKLELNDIWQLDKFMTVTIGNKASGLDYSQVYGINGMHQWLYHHLQKYPDAILPKQEAVITFTGKIRNTTTLYDGQSKTGIDLLKEVKKALNDKTTHTPSYPSYRSLGSIAGVKKAIAYANEFGHI